ncbi:Planctomycete cytochrome C [Roseimaritima multifibrata]|uniref:Planctomycete cytochrome C n=1 Tax=Roseimaritima multifibrata TaxID=1930274 RepID=A0A517M9J7_9BACT|nr:PSD1 and planctomycete cytochrome C domain-containing protein [Roseimaritima multifibrata]QDS91565.1 Planctomycete cytochrome C [Roseimaritima multifibrata]
MISLPALQIRRRRFGAIHVLVVTAIVVSSHCKALHADKPVSAEQQAATEAFFETKVRPLLFDKCISCHGAKKQHAGLRLDSRHAMLTGGDSGPSLVPMKPDESLLIEAVKRESFEMPPEESLDDDQVQILTRWIEMGAPWPGEVAAVGNGPDFANHWAFKPISRPELPMVRDTDWPRNAIDFFILNRLEQQGLSPSEPTTPAVLARRIKWDLVGLPATFEELAPFGQSDAATAIAQWTERWLDSPHYGERTGRHWLDVARYSDTKGYVFFEKHDFRAAYTYRDYVIDSFNADKPFNQFVREQLAADLMDDVPHESLAALGFIVVGPRFKNDNHEIIADRIDVVSRGLMGLTVACARCHDHKFDPVTIDDYYSLYGVFQNSIEPLQWPFRCGDEKALQDPQAVAIRKAAVELEQHYHAQYDKVMADSRLRLAEYLLAAQAQRGGVNTAAFDTVTDGDDLNPELMLIWKQFLDDTETSNDSVFLPWHQLAGLATDSFEAEAPCVLRSLTAADSKPTANSIVVKRLLDNPPQSLADVAKIYTQLAVEIETKSETSDPGSSDPAWQALRASLNGSSSPLQTPFHAFRILRLFPDRPSQGPIKTLNTALDSARAKASVDLAQMLVLEDADPLIDARVFRRGNSSSPMHVVPRRFPTFFASVSDQPFQHGSGRLELANAIVSPQNPLTARVIVNRIWHQHFGRGLVATPSNFGMQAPPPSHPELLDYLASWFIDHNWSIKSLRRLILDSATYQQQSDVDSETHTIDPDNQWCSRMNRRRLDFETMRDSLLSIRGDLDLTVGGPSAGDALAISNRRRSMYAHNNRLDVSGTMRLFDFPSPDISNGRRDMTSVPGQALFLMNHPLMLSTAAEVSQRAAKASTPAESVEQLFREILNRHPTTQELEETTAFLQRARKRQTEPPLPPSNWSYGYADVATDPDVLGKFAKLPFFNGTQFQGGPNLPDGKLGWVFLNATGGHPGNTPKTAAVIRWTAPSDMNVSVTGTLTHDKEPGDGIRGQIFAGGRRIAGPFVLHQDSVDTPVESVSLASGETLDFVVDIHGALGHDSFAWSPTIAEVASDPSTSKTEPPAVQSWNYGDQFRPEDPIRITPLQGVAQVLLMSNEFHFID